MTEQQHHSTTVIVDFDDTLAITLNRDWENAKPNQPLIDKLVQLKGSGWTVHVVTARGQLSCKGDSDAADKKYRTQIEKWLDTHGVPYDSLSFQKKLGAYYIDDKGITPEDFIERVSRVPLKGGWSGATVVRDMHTNTVLKTAKNTANAVLWYNGAEQNMGGKFYVPKIHTVIGDTIRMEYIEDHSKKLFSIDKCIDILQMWKNSYSLQFTLTDHPGPSRCSYVNRCCDRMEGVLKDPVLIRLREELEGSMKYDTPCSFSHGDFSSSNILFNSSGTPVLIDPIYSEDLYSSYIIDAGKLYGTLMLDSRISPALELLRQFGSSVITHCMGHYARMIPYATPEMRAKLISTIENHY